MGAGGNRGARIVGLCGKLESYICCMSLMFPAVLLPPQEERAGYELLDEDT